MGKSKKLKQGCQDVSNSIKLNDDITRHGSGSVCRVGQTEAEIQRRKYDDRIWEFEPNVGRVANGISGALDIDGIIDYICKYGCKNKIDVAKASAKKGRDGKMRILRLYLELTTTPPGLGHPGSSTGALPKMPHKDRLGKRQMEQGEKETTPMRDLSELVSAKVLSSNKDMQSEMPIDPGEVQRWFAVGQRVDRLKGLGNAIVPHVAYQFFKAIIEYENVNQLDLYEKA